MCDIGSKRVKSRISKSNVLDGRGVAEQTTEHILQDCGTLRGLREEIWPVPTCLQDKLYGPVGALRKSTDFICRSRLQV